MQQAICRLQTNEGVTLGAGVAIGPDHVLTCAHVVSQVAWQNGFITDRETDDCTGLTISLDFPIADTDLLQAEVTRYDSGADLALLTLAESIEEEVVPAKLTPTMADLRHHPCWMFGFPEEYPFGTISDGRLLGRDTRGWLFIEGEGVTGIAVQGGYSGTPVWDEMLGGIIGLVVQADKDQTRKVAMVIPTDRIAAWQPDVPVRAVTPGISDAVRSPSASSTISTDGGPAYTGGVTARDRGTVIGRDQTVNHIHNYFYGSDGPPLPAAELRAEQVATYLQETVKLLGGPLSELEERFVQLTLILDQGKDAQGPRHVISEQKEDRFEELSELLAKKRPPVAVVLGAPGSGKTVLLQKLQLDTARAGLAQDGQGPLPFFVRLNRYQDGAVPPLQWLSDEWAARYRGMPPLVELLEKGRILLLADGLNEMPHANQKEYRQKVGVWTDFIDTHLHKSRAIFSCRTLDYSATFSERSRVEVQQVQVQPLTTEKIQAFLHAYRPEVAEVAWEQIERDEQQLALYATPFFLKILIDQLGEEGEVPRGRSALMTGFVRRALYRELVERENPFLEESGLLSEDSLEEIEDQAWGASPYALPEDGNLIPALTRLAYNMQDGQESDGGLVSVPRKEARTLVGHPEGNVILLIGEQLGLLTREQGQQGYSERFWHQLFQEYFAARQLARVLEPERVAVGYLASDFSPTYEEEIEALTQRNEHGQAVSALPTTGWEETAVMAAAMTAHQDEFIRRLMAVNLPLAGRCAASVEVTVSPELEGELKEKLVERLENSQADVRARIRAGEELGYLGDPRFTRHEGHHGPYLLPPFIKVLAGRYRIGEDESQYEDEKPAHEVEIDEFKIAVYPVTNAEYRLFLESGGYVDEQWWETEGARHWLRGESTSEGQKIGWRSTYKSLQDFSVERIRTFAGTEEDINTWVYVRQLTPEKLEEELDRAFPSGLTYRMPSQWDNVRFNQPNQPVVGVSWYEARAYCAWLSAQSGRNYMLPTESEWEAAARRSRVNEYVYGPAYRIRGGNTFETRLLRTTPVGVFPEGRSPEGIFDLSGNVWEWTISLWGEELNNPTYRYPYQKDDGRENIDEPDAVRRVLRGGGSWGDDLYFARAALRGRSLPGNRDNSVGFRLVRRPPSHHRDY